MPVVRCQKNGKPGFRACPSCKCFTYNTPSGREMARARAERQLRAIKANQK